MASSFPMKPPQSAEPSSPTTQTEFLAVEQTSWRALSALWRGLPDEVLLRAGACGSLWSVKDVLNHIASWQEAAQRVINDLLADRWGRLGANTDKFNAQNFAADRDRPLAATRRRLTHSRRELLALLTTAPEKGLLNIYGRQQIGWWAKYSTYGHYREHVQALQDFRQKVKSK